MGRILLTALAVPLLLSCAPSGQEESLPTRPLALTPVTVVDVRDGRLLADRTVLVRGRRIAAVGPTAGIAVPDDARVIDAAGRYLIPGLWDMHVHAARNGRAPRFWPLLIGHGVTGIREMGSRLDSLLHWRAASRADGALAPRIHGSSPMLDGSPPTWPFGMTHPAGVGILAGTDASDEPYVFAGASLHDELELLVEAGLSPLEALRASTLEPARYMDATDSLGTIREGKLANLVLLDADPLEEIGNTRTIRAVVLDSRYLDRESLDGLLAEAERRDGPPPE